MNKLNWKTIYPKRISKIRKPPIQQIKKNKQISKINLITWNKTIKGNLNFKNMLNKKNNYKKQLKDNQSVS